jgi:Protein of unknown function (DUF1573)
MKNLKISVLALTIGLMSFTVMPTLKVSNKITISNSPISWKLETIDLGEIPQGTPKSMDFEFKNTGKISVLITNVHGSCGCTATDYTKNEILSGQSGKVTATFNAANKGAFTKTVTVTTNAETAPKVLTFKGTVI